MNTFLKAQSLAIATSLMLAGAVYAAPGTTSNKLIAEAGGEKAGSISLSTEQKESLLALKDKLALGTAQEKVQLKVDRHELFDLLSKPTVDKQAVLSLEGKMNTLRNELADAKVNYLLAASEVFTPAQKAQLHDRFLSRSLKAGFHNHKFGRKICSGSFGKCMNMKAKTGGNVNS
jgi:Spy/CpxP family protein refolding chaperone